MSKILLINASEDENGATATLGEKLLVGQDYEKLNLVDYKIYQIGQQYADDQFDEIYQKMVNANILVWATPIYWHDMSASLKTLIERISQVSGTNKLAGKRLILLTHGASSMDGVKTVTKIVKSFCDVGRIKYLGHANNGVSVALLKKKL